MIRFRYFKGQQSPNGFTLIELLVVIAIIGILIAMAIPQFNSYRRKAVDNQMIWDLKNAAIALESYYADKKIYTSALSDLQAVGFQQTQGVTLTITLTSPSSYTIIAAKPDGTKPSFSYNSTTGLIQ